MPGPIVMTAGMAYVALIIPAAQNSTMINSKTPALTTVHHARQRRDKKQLHFILFVWTVPWANVQRPARLGWIKVPPVLTPGAPCVRAPKWTTLKGLSTIPTHSLPVEQRSVPHAQKKA
mmetsp:Transcript_86956/g.153744  ORF Transcript_86956/g.153744 Transcript_86956/m.153744 type:complete len:119 (-) Transcript_86956:347-703(-)